jgi:hypothetical protein
MGFLRVPRPGALKAIARPEIRRRVGGSTAALTSKNLQMLGCPLEAPISPYTQPGVGAADLRLNRWGPMAKQQGRDEPARCALRASLGADPRVAHLSDPIGANIWAHSNFRQAMECALPAARAVEARTKNGTRPSAAWIKLSYRTAKGTGTSAASDDCRN